MEYAFLNKCVFSIVLNMVILVWSLISLSSPFQVLGADALNDRLPNATLNRQVGSSSIRPLDVDRKEYLLFSLIENKLPKYCGVLK